MTEPTDRAARAARNFGTWAARDDDFTAADWKIVKHQLDALRAWWRLRLDRAPAERVNACGHVWLADYGPLPCALPHGHDGRHRCYGSQGPIDFGPAAPRERAGEVNDA